jgi:hypothetical protein
VTHDGTAVSAAGTTSTTLTVNSPIDVTSVTYTTNSGTNEIDHTSHGTVTITLHFNGDVTVIGALTLSLNINAQPGTPEVATYVSGSGSDELVFTFSPSNNGNGGSDKTTALAITAVNGTITDLGGNAVDTSGADVTLLNYVHSPTVTLLEHLGVNEPAAPAGVAGSPINLALTDPSGVGALTTMTISGMPADWSLNQGTDLGNGTWMVQTNELSALTVTTAAGYAGAVVLGVTESWTNADGSTGTASVSDNVEAFAPGSPIIAWSGDDTLTASSGNDLFVFSQPIGHDTVYSFDTAADQIDLIGYASFTSFADVQAHITEDAAGNAVITLGTGQSITLQGVHEAALTDANFEFNQTPVLNNAGTMTISDGAMLPLSGTINNAGTIALNSTGDETDLQLIEHGVTLAGAGHVVLSDSVENVIGGTGADVTLTNVDNTISGAGQIGAGQLTLINEGTIDATGANSLTIDTGVNVVTNTGTLEATGSGGLTVVSAIANSGILWANGANLTVQGAVSGNGTALIDGAGTLDFEAASTANVVFDLGAAGTLKLGDSFHFNGTISGFQASDIIDLADMGFVTASISYHENTAGTGGTLAVSNGTQTVELSLLGHYTADNFSIVPDQAKGTIITYVPHDLVI